MMADPDPTDQEIYDSIIGGVPNPDVDALVEKLIGPKDST